MIALSNAIHGYARPESKERLLEFYTTVLGLKRTTTPPPYWSGSQRLDTLLEDTDPASIAHLVQASENDLAIGAVVFRDPLRDLLFKGIELGGPRWPWFRDHRLWMG